MSENPEQKVTLPKTGEQAVLPPAEESNHHDTFKPSKRRKFLIPALIGIPLLGGLGWIVFSRVIMPMIMFSQMKPQLTQVPLASPKSATIEDSSDYAASLDSRQSVNLQPRVSGQVSTIYVKAGDRVTAGTPLLQIDAIEQQAQVASRQAGVETAIAEVGASQADVNNAIDTLKATQATRAAAQASLAISQREYKRYEDLYKQGAESKQTLDQRWNALQSAQANLRQIDADIRAQQSTVNRNKALVVKNQRALQQSRANVAEGVAQLDYYRIKAPFTGVVGNIPIKVGDFVQPSTLMLTVTQNQNLEIQIPVPLDQAPKLRQGQTVKLLDDQGRVLQTGRISFIAPNVDPGTQSVQAKAVFQNIDNLRTAQFIRARVIWDTRPGVLVPTTAISRLGGKDFIFVAQPFRDSGCKEPAQSEGGGPTKVEPEQLVAAQKPISLGKIINNDQEVKDGVSAGDRIVTSGILQLQNCLPIAELTPTDATSSAK